MMKKIVALVIALMLAVACLPASAETVHYDSYCGMAQETVNGVPVAAWVRFNPDTQEIMSVYITGSCNAAVSGTNDVLNADCNAFIGVKAADAATVASEGPAAEAVKDACARYISGAAFVIRPYQTMAVDRYLANNPYFENLDADVTVDVAIVAAFPENCVTIETADVTYNDKVTYPAGVSTNQFTYGDKTVSVSHSVLIAHEPGVAVVSYSYNGETVLCALDVFENFTLYPEVLSGSDSYGKVAAYSVNGNTVSYIVLGDKAMNFPGGTAGSTLVYVEIDAATRTITKVLDLASSDSTYLANAWEYGGGFTNVGDALYAIDNFTSMFAGRSADTVITKYELSSSKNGIVGGVVVEGGIDMVVTGATRTPNAIISAVNAAIEDFQTR